MGDTAASRIRASVAALPDLAVEHWQRATQAHVIWTEKAARAINGHVALLASPDVATALADLLEAIRAEVDANDECDGFDLGMISDVYHRAAALEAAITKGADR